MFIYKTAWFFKYFAASWVSGIAIFPFILCKHAQLLENRRFINHERIHIRQQMEMLVFPFFVWYAIEYIVRIIQFRNTHLAYKNISFEREAYSNENDDEYLTSRRFWSFLQFV